MFDVIEDSADLGRFRVYIVQYGLRNAYLRAYIVQDSTDGSYWLDYVIQVEIALFDSQHLADVVPIRSYASQKPLQVIADCGSRPEHLAQIIENGAVCADFLLDIVLTRSNFPY